MSVHDAFSPEFDGEKEVVVFPHFETGVVYGEVVLEMFGDEG